MGTVCWTISGKSGEHKIVLNRGVNIRDSMSLVMDGKIVSTLQIPSSSIVAKLEYTFLCEDTPVTLIVFGNKAELIYQDVYQGSKKKYRGEPKIGLWYLILLIVMNIAVAVITHGTMIALAMCASCVVLSWVIWLTPFQSKSQKILKTVLILLLNLVVSVMSTWI